MLETVEDYSGGVRVRATVGRVGVYLDNFSIIELAKGDSERRDRLIAAFWGGADLLFSPMNAAEIIGPEGRSSDAVKSFVDAIGPHWYPLDASDPIAVMEREASGADAGSACTSTWFMNQFFAARNLVSYGEQRLNHVEPEFFQLGLVLDWLRPHRSDIRQRLAAADQRLGGVLAALQGGSGGIRTKLDTIFPSLVFDAARPATFAWTGLVRTLVLEAKAYPFKKGDVADLCHAVVGSAYAQFATLDKQWKRRVCSLRKPNGLARVYYQPELDQFVADLEAACKS